jgi:hypothetical protein
MTFKEFFAEVWRMLIGRVGGPMNFRLVIQPLVASLFAVRGALKDAREHRPPYFWSMLLHPAKRTDLFREGWKDIGKVFMVAVVLDVVYEIIEFRWVYPGQAVIVATVLAIVPYLVVRGMVNRLASRSTRNGSAQLSQQADGAPVAVKSESHRL